MKNYEHITKMENVLVQQRENMKEMNKCLDEIDAHREDYKDLMVYYYSDQRAQDLRDDSDHLIPDSLSRGVLSEDEIYDLIGDYRDTAFRMLETAIWMLKA